MHLFFGSTIILNTDANKTVKRNIQMFYAGKETGVLCEKIVEDRERVELQN